ncbi:mtor-associated protein meak7 [Anaeramoeba flamelloides]|uniref:Oxidation resistance protein 1 n=1 Tax=Anaeramoeba flamelloides TaxID=1746091 RepID=A0AAV7Z6M8_9EUKA|nr:mtor-associated protein meak7 [Anaeramoeba flamelloides]
MEEPLNQLLNHMTLLVKEEIKTIQINTENYLNTNLNQIIRKLNELDSQIQKLDKRVTKLEKSKQSVNFMNSKKIKNQGLNEIEPLGNILRKKSYQKQKKDQNDLGLGYEYEKEEKEVSQFWSEIDPESQNIGHELGSQSAPENMVLEEMNNDNNNNKNIENNNKNIDNYLFNQKSQEQEEENHQVPKNEINKKAKGQDFNQTQRKNNRESKKKNKVYNTPDDPDIANNEDSDEFQTDKTLNNHNNILNFGEVGYGEDDDDDNEDNDENGDDDEDDENDDDYRDHKNNQNYRGGENGKKKKKKILKRKKKRYSNPQYMTPKSKTPYSSKNKKQYETQQTPVQRAKRLFTEKSQKSPFLSPKTPSFETIRKLPFAISMIGEAEKRERELLKFNPNFNYRPFGESDILDEALAMVLYLAIPFKVLPQTVLLYSDLKNERSLREFHSLVDNKGATIIIMRNEDGFIFGGFASSKWNADQVYFGNSKCFLFNLSLDTKIPYLKKKQKKCLWGSKSSIKFGTTDLVLQQDFQNCYSRIEGCYGVGLGRNSIEAKTLLTGEDHFIPEIIEVFGFAKLEN